MSVPSRDYFTLFFELVAWLLDMSLVLGGTHASASKWYGTIPWLLFSSECCASSNGSWIQTAVLSPTFPRVQISSLAASFHYGTIPLHHTISIYYFIVHPNHLHTIPSERSPLVLHTARQLFGHKVYSMVWYHTIPDVRGHSKKNLPVRTISFERLTCKSHWHVVIKTREQKALLLPLRPLRVTA